MFLIILIGMALLIGVPSKMLDAVSKMRLNSVAERVIVAFGYAFLAVGEFVLGLAWWQGSDLVELGERSTGMIQVLGGTAMFGSLILVFGSFSALLWKDPELKKRGDSRGYCPVCGLHQGYFFDGSALFVCGHHQYQSNPELYCTKCGIERPKELSTCVSCNQRFLSSELDVEGQGYSLIKSDNGYELILWVDPPDEESRLKGHKTAKHLGEFPTIEAANIELARATKSEEK